MPSVPRCAAQMQRCIRTVVMMILKLDGNFTQRWQKYSSHSSHWSGPSGTPAMDRHHHVRMQRHHNNRYQK